MRVNQGAKEGAVVARTVFLALLSVNAVGDCTNMIKNDAHEDDLDE